MARCIPSTLLGFRTLRLLAVLRRRYGGIALLAAFIAGQVAFAALWRSPIWCVVAPTLLCACGIAALSRERRSPLVRSAEALMLSFLAGVATMTTALPEPFTYPAGVYTIEGIVGGEIRRRNVGAVTFPLTVTSLSLGADAPLIPERGITLHCAAIELPWRGIARVRSGDTIVASAAISPLSPPTLFSYKGHLVREGYSAQCRVKHGITLDNDSRLAAASNRESSAWRSSARASFRATLHSVLGQREIAGLLESMAIGTRDTVSDRTEETFRRSGLTHLLVLSGTQLTTVYLIARAFVLAFLIIGAPLMVQSTRAIASYSGVIAAIAMLGIVGFEGSGVRAAVGAVIAAWTITRERSRSVSAALTTSLLIISVIYPGAVLDPGMQLTYGALVGIALGGRSPGRRSIVWRGIESAVFASLLTSAVSVLWFQELSPIGLILNASIAPVLSFLGFQGTVIGVSLAALGLPEILSGVATVMQWVVHTLEVLCNKVPYASFEVSPLASYGFATAIIILVGATAIHRLTHHIGKLHPRSLFYENTLHSSQRMP